MTGQEIILYSLLYVSGMSASYKLTKFYFETFRVEIITRAERFEHIIMSCLYSWLGVLFMLLMILYKILQYHRHGKI